MASGSAHETFETGLSRALLDTHRADQRTFAVHMNAARQVIMVPLAAAARESYRRAYRFCIDLHMLSELEQAQQLLSVQKEVGAAS